MNTYTSTKLKRILYRRAIRRSRMRAFALLSVIAVIVGGMMFAHRTVANERFDVVTVTVKEGDTLWGLASKYGGGNGDVRKLVYKISKLNSIDNACVRAGDVIYIPQ